MTVAELNMAARPVRGERPYGARRAPSIGPWSNTTRRKRGIVAGQDAGPGIKQPSSTGPARPETTTLIGVSAGRACVLLRRRQDASNQGHSVEWLEQECACAGLLATLAQARLVASGNDDGGN